MTTYPYTATRVKTMKSSLLKKDDYLKLMNMGVFGIIKFLESNVYKEDIQKISDLYKGNEMINIALNKNLARILNKILVTLNKKDSIVLIKTYMNKWVFYNLKLLIRIKINGFGDEEMKYNLIPINPTNYALCSKMLEDEKILIEETSRLTEIDKEVIRDLFEKKDIVSIENKIDKKYYQDLQKLVKNSELPADLKKFLELTINMINIRNILKLKVYGGNIGDINFILTTQDLNIVRRMIDSDLEECINIIKKSKFKHILNGIDKSMSMIDNNIEKELLSYSNILTHKKPLSISPIFGYLIGKELEIRNLRILINSKANEIEESFIKENLII